MIENDELKIYRGENYIINEHISIHQPTLGEICDWGEGKYFNIIYNIVATPTDMKYMLSLKDIDWNECEDFQLFLMLYKLFTKEETKIIFGDLDFTKYEICRNRLNGEICLYNEYTDSVIDKSIYELIVSYLRKAHNIEKNVEKAMTETTRIVLLEEAKEQYEESQRNKKHKSKLKPLISTMINMSGFNYNHNTIWDMKINAFMDSVQRIRNIKTADLLLTSGYSGFGVDLSKINKNKLNYFSELSE